MFLSKVVINPKDRDSRYFADNADFWHKRIMSGFEEQFDTSPRKKMGIMHRKEETSNGTYILVQSAVEPNWYGKSWIQRADVKCIDKLIDSLKNGKNINFDLLCIPCYTDKETNKRRCFKTPEEKIGWLQEKAKYNGFTLNSCEVIPCNRVLLGLGGNNKTKLYMTNLRGNMTVTDAEKFIEFYKDGVGRQKSYGAGMLMLF